LSGQGEKCLVYAQGSLTNPWHQRMVVAGQGHPGPPVMTLQGNSLLGFGGVWHRPKAQNCRWLPTLRKRRTDRDIGIRTPWYPEPNYVFRWLGPGHAGPRSDIRQLLHRRRGPFDPPNRSRDQTPQVYFHRRPLHPCGCRVRRCGSPIRVWGSRRPSRGQEASLQSLTRISSTAELATKTIPPLLLGQDEPWIAW